MRSNSPDKFLKVRKLVKKLDDIAVVLDEVSRKMQYAVEKHRTKLGIIDFPAGDVKKYLDLLHRKLECLEGLPIGCITVGQAKSISESLLEPMSLAGASERMAYHEYLEFTCIEEFQKFRSMPALTEADIQLCDWEELYEKFATVE